MNSLEPLNQWYWRKAFAARKAFCTVAFRRDTHSARYLQAWLDLTIKTGTKCPCLPREDGRILRPSCIILLGSWTLVSETQKPAWSWIAGNIFLWNRRVKAWRSSFRRNCWACRVSDDEFFQAAFLTRNVAMSLKVQLKKFLFKLSFCRWGRVGRRGFQFLLFFEPGLFYLLFFYNEAGSCQHIKGL